MKQLLSGFAPRREPPRSISSRLQPPLHRLANPQIFILDLVPYRNTLLVISAGPLANVAEIKIKYYPAMIHIDRNNQIRIKIPLVAIEHEIRMQPEIPRSIAPASRAHSFVFVGTYHRA